MRFFEAIVSMLAVTVIVFLMVRISGDPVQMLLPLEATPDQKELLTKALGLDKPIVVQYWRYLTGLARVDFGVSTRTRLPVRDLILSRLPATLELGVVALGFAFAIALPIGIYSAYWRDTPLDLVARLFAILGQSLPAFWTGILLILIFGVYLKVLPAGGRGTPLHLVLPAFTLGWFAVAGVMRLTRSSMLEVLGSEYIKLARAKGVPERTILWKHALRNAAIPVLTFASVISVIILSGSVVTETVFAWPGMGRLMIEGAMARDFPLVQGVVLLFSAMYIGGNLLVDISYVYLNPRLRK